MKNYQKNQILKVVRILLIFTLFTQCQNSNTGKSKFNLHNNDVNSTNMDTVLNNVHNELIDSLFPSLNKFLNSKYINIGAIQVSNPSNKLYKVKLGYFENYEKIPYTVYLVPKIDIDSLRKIDLNECWISGKNELFKKFCVIVFKYPILDPDKQNDYHDLNIKFPCKIEAFKIINESIENISFDNCNDFNCITDFQTKVIINILKF